MPTNDHLKNYEESIRADERAKVAKRYDKAIDLIAKGLSMLDRADPQPLSAPQAKAKVTRTVKAADLQRDTVFHALATDGAFSIKEIDRVAKIGPKITGAALRRLVAEGKAVEGPRGKFKAVQVVVADLGAAMDEKGGDE